MVRKKKRGKGKSKSMGMGIGTKGRGREAGWGTLVGSGENRRWAGTRIGPEKGGKQLKGLEGCRAVAWKS